MQSDESIETTVTIAGQPASGVAFRRTACRAWECSPTGLILASCYAIGLNRWAWHMPEAKDRQHEASLEEHDLL
jgi:hypothetical protein